MSFVCSSAWNCKKKSSFRVDPLGMPLFWKSSSSLAKLDPTSNSEKFAISASLKLDSSSSLKPDVESWLMKISISDPVDDSVSAGAVCGEDKVFREERMAVSVSKQLPASDIGGRSGNSSEICSKGRLDGDCISVSSSVRGVSER